MSRIEADMKIIIIPVCTIYLYVRSANALHEIPHGYVSRADRELP